MLRIVVSSLVLIIALLAGVDALPAADKQLSETQKIDSLIEQVKQLDGAKFVRNGKEYDAGTAAKFLRGKWDANASAIKTAADFIRVAATESSTSGKPYLIRHKNGTEQPSAEFLNAALKKLN